MKDHWENDEKMMRENTREPVVSFLILPGVTRSCIIAQHTHICVQIKNTSNPVPAGQNFDIINLRYRTTMGFVYTTIAVLQHL